MKIALVNRLDLFLREKKKFSTDMFPLGLAIVASVMRNAGFKPVLFDTNINDMSVDELSGKLVDFDVVCMSILYGSTMGYYLELIEKIKKKNPNIKVVVGGPMPTSMQKEFLEQTSADVVVVGEGETTTVELLNAVEKRMPLDNVKGIYFRENNRIKVNPPQKHIENMDDVPFPAWDLFDIKRYFTDIKVSPGKRAFSVITSRGCPYNCQFCTHAFGRRWKGQSVERIMAEIQELKSKYKIDALRLVDDNFIFERSRVIEFSKAIKKEDIKWICLGRVNNVDKEMVLTMKSSGCVSIQNGIESASDRVLKVMQKGFTVRQLYDYVKLMKNVKMLVKGSLMLGVPTETKQDAMQTLKFAKHVIKNVKGSMLSCGYFNIRPNIPWYHLAICKGLKPLTIRQWIDIDLRKGVYFNMSAMTEKELKEMFMRINMATLMSRVGLKRAASYLFNIKNIKQEFIPFFFRKLSSQRGEGSQPSKPL